MLDQRIVLDLIQGNQIKQIPCQRNLLFFIGGSYMKRPDEKVLKDNNRTALDFYREYRGMNISELANASGVSRQTVGMACRGELKLGEKRLRKLAAALNVDLKDIDQDLDLLEVPKKVVDIPAQLKRFEDQIAVCKPDDIRRKMDNVIAYLSENSGDVHNVLTYLLTAANGRGKFLAGRLVDNLCSRAYCYEGYKPKVQVGYYAVDEEAGEYQAFVLFEDWVYDVLGMDSPLQQMEIPRMDGTGTDVQNSLDFAIPIQYDSEDETMNFESQLLDQIQEYLWDVEAADIPNPKLAELFDDLIDDMYTYGEICEYTCEDYDPMLPYKMKKREEKYTQLLYKVLQQEGNMEDAVRKAAQLFCQMHSEEDGEEKVFESYGLNDKI